MSDAAGTATKGGIEMNGGAPEVRLRHALLN
jgi:hypothetical protein